MTLPFIPGCAIQNVDTGRPVRNAFKRGYAQQLHIDKEDVKLC